MLPSRYGLNFNLSHSGDIIALAVARMPVGIDVERERQDVDCHALAQGLFIGRERAIVGAGSDAQERRAFFAIWTRKRPM